LLLFSGRLGIGFASSNGTLTLGLTAIFSQFIMFIGVLVLLVGAVLTSFIVNLMMAQRTRDFGLIKAAGCPNSLVAGYFLAELLTVTVIGCVLGIVFGFLADFAVAEQVFGSYQSPNLLSAPIAFGVFFLLALFFGVQPLLKASKISAVAALSTVNYYGIAVEGKHKALSKRALTWKIASRSLSRRVSSSVRIVVLLSVVFVLLTVAVGGGIIASGTTISWVQMTSDQNTVAVANTRMGTQYEMLLANFSQAKSTGDFDYSDPNLAVPSGVAQQLEELVSVSTVDSRLVLRGHIEEVSNFTIDPDTLTTYPVGDDRESDVLLVGVDPQNLASDWQVKGRFLGANQPLEAVIGDSVAQTMYTPNVGQHLIYSDPLVEGLRFENNTFQIVGVCVDPLANGYVAYVPLAKLQSITGTDSTNLLLVKLNPKIDHNAAITEVKAAVKAVNPDLDVFDLSAVMDKNTDFLSSTWQTMMFMPLLSLVSAALGLVGYMMLSIDEQHQEFGVLRAVGAKSRIIVAISGVQSAVLLLSSCSVGLTFGVMTTLMVLMPNPFVTGLTLVEISAWFLAALLGMFLLSLIPAFRLAKASILKIMA
jgi:putative ABC transport system permease protein